MFRYLGLQILIIVFCLSPQTQAFSKEKKIKLSNKVVNSFYSYISANRKPLDKFLVTEDGTGTFIWVCPQTLCFPTGEKFYLKPCSKLNDNKPCKIFAANRKIKLMNGDKRSKDLKKFKQGESLNDVKSKLKKLGFID